MELTSFFLVYFPSFIIIGNLLSAFLIESFESTWKFENFFSVSN